MMRPSRHADAVRCLPGRIGGGLGATACLAVITISKPGVAASGDVDKTGAFRIPPVPMGVYRVGFDDHVPSPEAMENGARYQKLPVHERYRSPTTSGIECEIKPGRNTAVFGKQVMIWNPKARSASEGMSACRARVPSIALRAF